MLAEASGGLALFWCMIGCSLSIASFLLLLHFHRSPGDITDLPGKTLFFTPVQSVLF